MAVTHDLPGLRAAGAESHAIDDAVQTALESSQQVLAGDALLQRRFLENVAELGFQDAVDAARFLLFAQLQAVAHQFRFAVFTMLAGDEIALLDRALFAVAAFTLEE